MPRARADTRGGQDGHVHDCRGGPAGGDVAREALSGHPRRPPPGCPQCTARPGTAGDPRGLTHGGIPRAGAGGARPVARDEPGHPTGAGHAWSHGRGAPGARAPALGVRPRPHRLPGTRPGTSPGSGAAAPGPARGPDAAEQRSPGAARSRLSSLRRPSAHRPGHRSVACASRSSRWCASIPRALPPATSGPCWPWTTTCGRP